jgi:hypothetical protein
MRTMTLCVLVKLLYKKKFFMLCKPNVYVIDFFKKIIILALEEFTKKGSFILKLVAVSNNYDISDYNLGRYPNLDYTTLWLVKR